MEEIPGDRLPNRMSLVEQESPISDASDEHGESVILWIR